MEPIEIGRYRAVQLLGRGGMGAVYLATDPALDRQIVIKLLASAHDDEQFRTRFLREARSAARITHRNIVTVYDVGTDPQDRPYIAMEYVDGESLAAIIRRRAPLTVGQKLDYLKQLCAGLATAHSAGIIHRDVKPANIMVDRSSTIKILDFGLAHLQHDSGLTQVGTVMGTLNYMSPEQFTGQPVDIRSDIFAVGAVAYELLAYRQAFPGRLDSGAMHRLMTASPEPLRQAVPGIDPDLEAIVAKCLQKAPADRYQDLRSMSADIERLLVKLAGRADSILEPTPPELPASGSIVDPLGAEHATRLMQRSGAEPGTVPPADPGTRYFPPADDDDARSQQMPDVQLVISSRGAPGLGDRVVRITGARTVIGRHASCDVVLPDPACSSRHAAIVYAEGSFTLEDLGSRNGTYVNGSPVHGNAAVPLIFGARIEIGRTSLRFSYSKDTRLPDLAGARLTTRYGLTRLLRESEKSAFYVAVDRHVGVEVAVKVFSPELARHPAYEEQFKREARIAAQLEHPHICRLLDSGVGDIALADGRRLPRAPYLCYQLMAGGNLAERLDGDTPVDLQTAGHWTRLLGDALVYAHARDVVHGDLKPTAIVFNSVGLPFLTDFAIAHRAESADARPTIGWPEYMAPEQWDGGTATEATDQFALAALLYRMVTGSVPFEGQDNRKQRERNFRDGPVAAHKEAAHNGRQGVSSELSAVLHRALGTDPRNRFRNMEDFVAAVVPLLREDVRPKARHDVFVSYDRELSGAWAKQLETRLQEKHNLRVFMDTTGLDRAGSFPPRIAAAIENSGIFVCFLASTTLESKWVRTEIETAHRNGKTMIPVFQETFSYPQQSDADPALRALVDSQGVKLYDKSMEYIDEAMKRIANLVIGALREPE